MLATFLHVTWYAETRFWVFAGATALLVAGIHFWFSAFDTVGTVVRSLDGQQPDPQDDIHKMLMNVMQEVHVVTGQKRTMQCVVIPTLSMNALAVADLKGEACHRDHRRAALAPHPPALEAVIAHEAHHILSGDCLETTVAASLFGSYSTAMEKLTSAARGRTFASPAFLLAWILLQLSSLLNMFISREREYRADAASVRMTRNPIALAETLHLLSRRWRGAGFIGSGFEMLCIVNPQATALDEQEGFWADLLSTHPPLRKRMDILLKMARVSLAESACENHEVRHNEYAGTRCPAVLRNEPGGAEWQGPFTLVELAALPWLSPLTWFTKGKDQPVERASKEPCINDIFLSRLSGQDLPLSNFSCPSCSQPLVTESYEGTWFYQCRFCAGILVDSVKIPRIIARTGRDRPCSERINSLAKTVVKENQLRQPFRKYGIAGRSAIPLLPCPKCRNPMSRGFYSQGHLIEVDRCSFCGITWFDQDELEMLQCLIENRIVPDITGTDHVGRSNLYVLD